MTSSMSKKHTLYRTAQHFSVAISRLALDNQAEFDRCIDTILNTSGHVIVCGMGKSGLIGQKISASLSSTGTPSFFMHPGEALHGDLGMITQHDTLLLISNSGETSEMLTVLPALSRLGNPIIGMAKHSDSSLAKLSHVFLKINYDSELCPNNLAPTTSTLLTLALGDAITVALIEARSFKPQDFAKYHPGGSLGRRLLTLVKDMMHRPPFPTVESTVTLREALLVMTEGRLGLCVINKGNAFAGVLTDGDVRRAILAQKNALELEVSAFMSRSPVCIHEDARFEEAESLMRNQKVKQLIAQNDTGEMTGIIEIFD